MVGSDIALCRCWVRACPVRKNMGSPQELVITVVLRGFLRFLKSDIFGVGHGYRCVSTTLRQSAWEFSDFPAQPKAVLAC